MPNVSLDQIFDTTKAALEKHGAAPWVAEQVALAVRQAEARGNKICGLYYLESYCQQLQTGRVLGSVMPQVSHDKGASVVVDAQFGFAQPAFSRALPQALQAAKEHGIASLAVCHAHTCTSLGYFTEQIARHGLIGIGMTNASPIVAPPGGKNRVIGTNPIAFSVPLATKNPAGQHDIMMQFDQSTTTVALGKITMAKAAGTKIPLGWALDKDGQPTTDPEQALLGSLVSVGGYKGWGFGLMAEVLAAGLCASTLSSQVKPLKAPEGPHHDLGQYYILIDPSNAPDFFERMQQLSASVAQDQGTRLPGQALHDQDPVALDDKLWHTIQKLAGQTEPVIE